MWILYYILQNVKYILLSVLGDNGFGNRNMSDLAQKLRDNPPIKQFRIGEVVQFSGLSRQTVHNYTIMGLISENERTEGGHRLYPESVFDTLARIEHLKRTKTLREIRHILDRERRLGHTCGEPMAPIERLDVWHPDFNR